MIISQDKEQLFLRSPLPAFILSIRGEILAMNEEAEALVSAALRGSARPGDSRLGEIQAGGTSPDDGTGLIRLGEIISAEYRNQFTAHLMECRNRNRAVLSEFSLPLGSDNHWFMLFSRTSGAPDDGSYIHSIAVPADDLREQRDIDLIAQDDAARERRQRSMLLGQISNELRSPVRSLMQLSSLLAEQSDGSPSNTVKDLARTINRTSKEVSGLLESLQDMGLMDGNRFELRPNPFNLVAGIDILYERFAPLALARGLNFYKRVQPLSDYFFEGDERRIRQIISILLQNALDYTRTGQVDLIIREEPISDYLSEITIEVRDTGPGIPAHLQNDIWDGIYGEGHSSGMSLPIARRLSRLMGGQLYFQTTRNMGTSFFLILPLKRVQESESGVLQQQGQDRLKNLRILLSETLGEEKSLQQLIDSLTGDGHLVISTPSVQEIPSLLEFTTFDALIIDLDGLPEHGANEQSHGPAEPASAGLPVIGLCSDPGRAAGSRTVRGTRVQELVQKPVNPRELYLALARVL